MRRWGKYIGPAWGPPPTLLHQLQLLLTSNMYQQLIIYANSRVQVHVQMDHHTLCSHEGHCHKWKKYHFTFSLFISVQLLLFSFCAISDTSRSGLLVQSLFIGVQRASGRDTNKWQGRKKVAGVQKKWKGQKKKWQGHKKRQNSFSQLISMLKSFQ